MENKEETIKDQKMLMVRIDTWIHTEAKVMATKKHQTLSTYVRRAILAALKIDKEQGI